jgi:hypothetical protein
MIICYAAWKLPGKSASVKVFLGHQRSIGVTNLSETVLLNIHAWEAAIGVERVM